MLVPLYVVDWWDSYENFPQMSQVWISFHFASLHHVYAVGCSYTRWKLFLNYTP